MKILCVLLAFAGTLAAAPQPSKADEINYDFLVKVGDQTGYCDHIPHIRKILENHKVKIFLEFGLGYSTKYFLDNCTKVISVEFVMRGTKPDWMKYCLDLYKGYSNWVPVSYFSNYPGDFAWAPYKYFGTSKLYEAETAYSATLQMPADEGYLGELKTFIGNLMKFNKVDVALVDPITLLRGPIVQLLFDKAPIIVAHDCATYVQTQIPDIYGYRRVVPPDHYETIYINKGKGTLIWIKISDETALLIQTMKEYAQSF